MKNPFVKEDNTGILVAAAIGTVAAGALAYLYLTESGNKICTSIKQQLKSKAKDLASAIIISDNTRVKKSTVKGAANHGVK